MKRLSGAIAAASLWCAGLSGAAAQAPPSERLLDIGGGTGTRARSSEPGNTTGIRRSTMSAKLRAPVSVGGGNAFVLGVSYEGQFLEYSDFATRTLGGITVTPDSLPSPLHALDVSAGLVSRLAERWTAAASFAPGLHSDFGAVRSRDVIWAGNLLFIRRLDENERGDSNRIGFGAAFSDRFGAPLPIPLLLLDWYPSERWSVRGTLPLDLDAGYRLSPALTVGLEALLKGYQFRLERAPFGGEVVRYREVQLGAFVDHGLTRTLRLRLSAGVSAGHVLELRDERNDHALQSGDLGESAFLRGALYYAP